MEAGPLTAIKPPWQPWDDSLWFFLGLFLSFLSHSAKHNPVDPVYDMFLSKQEHMGNFWVNLDHVPKSSPRWTLWSSLGICITSLWKPPAICLSLLCVPFYLLPLPLCGPDLSPSSSLPLLSFTCTDLLPGDRPSAQLISSPSPQAPILPQW